MGFASHLKPRWRDVNPFAWFFQNLRAQEAAQAEAEDREDLEIAAEVAGTKLHPKPAWLHGIVSKCQLL